MRNNFVPIALSFTSFIIFLTPSIAEQEPSFLLPVDQILNKTSSWLEFSTKFNQPRIELTTSTIIAALLSFLASSISSAGGIGGGGLYVPIMTIVAGLDLKTASSFSAFMVTGGSIANVGCNLFVRNPKSGGKTLIDYDLALLLEPCMLLGVSIGVICNLVFPNWLITILFAVFLAWSTMKTFGNGIFYWRLESEMVKIREENRTEEDDDVEKIESLKLPLLDYERPKRFPWIKLGVLVIIWFSYFAVYLLRGNKYGEGIISIEPCGMTYWLLSSTQIPLTLFFTLWICFSDNVQSSQSSDHQVSIKDVEDLTSNDDGERSNKCMFPVMALLAGLLGGVFGIGGGMLISPLLLQVGIAPEVTAATCSFMVLFSSTMSAIQYLLLGMEHTGTASIFAVICFVASLVGLKVVQKVINEYGRASIIVFSVGIVMALSIVLMTSYGALDVWNDYVSGRYMGFKLPC
ncbi:Sulfite exporter TauE/SafE family protein 2 [Cardamine amara subsp. amara]|uniref:Sulfite exporter TauE/SafE family protein 2 n=1 Tax=Cardamine amara subsp. amara TaxID=228776 RepID=A0ABD0ZHK4_CARAN